MLMHNAGVKDDDLQECRMMISKRILILLSVTTPTNCDVIIIASTNIESNKRHNIISEWSINKISSNISP